jgi:hypothetical protein
MCADCRCVDTSATTGKTPAHARADEPACGGFDTHVVTTEKALSTTDRWRIAVGGSGARCHGCDSCRSRAVSHSSDRSAAGFPDGCSSRCHRCGPTPMRGAGPATRWLRHRLRSSPIERRRDIAECSELGGCRSTPRRIRANVWYRSRAGPTPDMYYCSRSSGCASRVLNRSRDTVSCSEVTTGYRQSVVAEWSPLSGLNRWPSVYKTDALPLS